MNTRKSVLALAGIVGLYAMNAIGLQAPSQEQINELKRTGKFERAVERARKTKNHAMSDGMVERAKYKIKKAKRKLKLKSLVDSGYSMAEAEEAVGALAAPPPARQNLPTTGTPKTLTILIDFNDYRAASLYPNISVADIEANIYGSGTAKAQEYFYPRESLNAYYKRASCGKLDIQGDVIGWYNFPHNRSFYVADDGSAAQFSSRTDFITHIMDDLNSSYDFSDYDNDNDGTIDLINVIWTGPKGDWATFWWGVYTSGSSSKSWDGVKIGRYTWQWMATRDSDTDFNPYVLIHETGHGLGLPDYYDYNDAYGPDGGVGGYDMMHDNRCNHNAFSRWMLDWIDPIILSSEDITPMSISAGGLEDPKNSAVVIFPENNGALFDEFFIVENRHRVGNDEENVADGLAVWHVDATLSGSRFRYDNSYTSRKLLQRVQADGLGEIEANQSKADAGDFYASGDTFTPISTPDTYSYDGHNTSVYMYNVSPARDIMWASLGFSMGNMSIFLPMDEINSGVVQDYRRSNDASMVGTVSEVAGVVDGALHFNGSSYLRVPDHPSLNFGLNSFSMSALVKTTEAYQSVLDKRGPNGGGYHVYIYGGSLLFQLTDVNGKWANYYNPNIDINDGSWHMIGVSLDRSPRGKEGRLFVDGVCVHTFDPSGVPGSTTIGADLLIGGHRDGISRAFEGDMDEFALYARALSDEEMNYIYHAGTPAVKKDLLNSGLELKAQWSFTCGDAYDVSGNGCHGTLDGATITPRGLASFDGINDRIVFARDSEAWKVLNPVAAGYEEWILEAYILMDDPTDYYSYIFSHPACEFSVLSVNRDALTARSSWRLNNVRSEIGMAGGRWGSGVDIWSNRYYDGSAYYWGHEMSAPISAFQDRRSVRLRVVYKDGEVRQYENGHLLSVHPLGKVGPIMPSTSTLPAYIGCRFTSDGWFYDGYIDYIRIYAK